MPPPPPPRPARSPREGLFPVCVWPEDGYDPITRTRRCFVSRDWMARGLGVSLILPPAERWTDAPLAKRLGSQMIFTF